MLKVLVAWKSHNRIRSVPKHSSLRNYSRSNNLKFARHWMAEKWRLDLVSKDLQKDIICPLSTLHGAVRLLDSAIQSGELYPMKMPLKRIFVRLLVVHFCSAKRKKHSLFFPSKLQRSITSLRMTCDCIILSMYIQAWHFYNARMNCSVVKALKTPSTFFRRS